jgi:2-polyprenyl-3-methyl-5-hydroxy-6-metoxy-1,4-benzoquinol methylase
MAKKNNEILVKELYEKYPYPNRGIKTKNDAKRYINWILKIFKETPEYLKNKEILDLGCGTGELANSLAIFGAKVTAIDLSKNSIKKAKENSKKLKTKVNFLNKNILEYGEKKEYDLVIALGSLHHTINAKKGFCQAEKHLKKDGLIIIGLYNKYSRFRHRIKRLIIRVLAGNDIDKRIKIGEKLFKKNSQPAWLADKFGQPHETYHSVSELKKWFDEKNIELIGKRPDFKTPIIDEIKWLIKKENAFFVFVGKKKDIKENL